MSQAALRLRGHFCRGHFCTLPLTKRKGFLDAPPCVLFIYFQICLSASAGVQGEGQGGLQRRPSRAYDPRSPEPHRAGRLADPAPPISGPAAAPCAPGRPAGRPDSDPGLVGPSCPALPRDSGLPRPQCGNPLEADGEGFPLPHPSVGAGVVSLPAAHGGLWPQGSPEASRRDEP